MVYDKNPAAVMRKTEAAAGHHGSTVSRKTFEKKLKKGVDKTDEMVYPK